MGGLLNLVGWPDRPPVAIGAHQAYFSTSVVAANATLLAMIAREADGEGQHVDVSMQESVALDLEAAMQQFDIHGRVIKRGGHRFASIVPERRAGLGGLGRLFPCSDGHINTMIGMLRQEEWEEIRRLMASEGLAQDLMEPEWDDLEYAHQHVDHVREVLTAFTAQHTRFEMFAKAHFPPPTRMFIMLVNTAEDIAGDPHLAARQYFLDVDHPELDAKLKYPGGPFSMSETPWGIERRAPLLGEHNHQVWVEETGLTDSEYTELRRRGAI
jgi:crotonobetainyl-CoA:carnitine CoA-transferase CaiB-like acyl-CoA transferase